MGKRRKAAIQAAQEELDALAPYKLKLQEAERALAFAMNMVDLGDELQVYSFYNHGREEILDTEGIVEEIRVTKDRRGEFRLQGQVKWWPMWKAQINKRGKDD